MEPDDAIATAPNVRSARASFFACIALIALFGLLSYIASTTKSATYDEPLHVVGAYVHRFEHDYRINPEDPALLGLWASIPMTRGTLHPDTESKVFHDALAVVPYQWQFTKATMYRTQGIDADAILNRSRAMFTLIGVALAGVIAGWARKLGGSIACVVACALVCLDPNFLAHASLVKNDVALSLLMLMLGVLLFKAGQDGRVRWFALAGLSAAAALNVKFSGLLFGPITALLLAARALLPEPWTVAGVTCHTRRSRLLAAAVACAGIAAICFIFTWAAYGFRFNGTPNGPLQSFESISAFGLENLRIINNASTAPPPTATLRAVRWLHDHHVLPQGWLIGFLYTYATTRGRSMFLLGQMSIVGSPSYYPIAMFFKTPIGTLLMIGGAVAMFGVRALRGKARTWDLRRWQWLCLAIPPVIYMAAAITSDLNIGLRHVLPIYPYLYVLAGIGAASAMRRWGRPALFVVAGCVALTALESLIAWPNEIPFFNVAARPLGGGIEILSDSNLDWGQDLKSLAHWRDAHRDLPLYLSYFGTADPAYYKLDARILAGSGADSTADQVPLKREHAYIAISATNLQGTYLDPIAKEQYGVFKIAADHEVDFGGATLRPLEVLGGGTIYLYELTPKP